MLSTNPAIRRRFGSRKLHGSHVTISAADAQGSPVTVLVSLTIAPCRFSVTKER